MSERCWGHFVHFDSCLLKGKCLILLTFFTVRDLLICSSFLAFCSVNTVISVDHRLLLIATAFTHGINTDNRLDHNKDAARLRFIFLIIFLFNNLWIRHTLGSTVDGNRVRLSGEE